MKYFGIFSAVLIVAIAIVGIVPVAAALVIGCIVLVVISQTVNA